MVSFKVILVMAVVWRNAAAMTVLEKEGTGRREGLIPLQMKGEGKSFPE